jgi:hypothetical protein
VSQSTHRRTLACLAGVCLAASLAGCRSSADIASSTEPDSSPSTPTTWAPPPPPDGTTTLINTGDYTFRSPSGNITCHLLDLPNTISTRCEVGHYTYQPPANPGVGCPRLNSITIGAEGPSEFTCAPQAPAGDPKTLAYWDSVQVGRFTCKSKDTGVTCENTQTNHGFDLGADAFRRY